MFKTRTAHCLHSGCLHSFWKCCFYKLIIGLYREKAKYFFIVVLCSINIKRYSDAFLYKTSTFIKALQILYDQLTASTCINRVNAVILMRCSLLNLYFKSNSIWEINDGCNTNLIMGLQNFLMLMWINLSGRLQNYGINYVDYIMPFRLYVSTFKIENFKHLKF